jgi:23S rRNA G2445 N2-methylase RlmL
MIGHRRFTELVAGAAACLQGAATGCNKAVLLPSWVPATDGTTCTMAVAPLPHRGTAATTAVEGWVVSRRVLGPSLSFVTLASRADACSCCARARAARQLELTDIVFDRGVFRGDPDGAAPLDPGWLRQLGPAVGEPAPFPAQSSHLPMHSYCRVLVVRQQRRQVGSDADPGPLDGGAPPAAEQDGGGAVERGQSGRQVVLCWALLRRAPNRERPASLLPRPSPKVMEHWLSAASPAHAWIFGDDGGDSGVCEQPQSLAAKAAGGVGDAGAGARARGDATSVAMLFGTVASGLEDLAEHEVREVLEPLAVATVGGKCFFAVRAAAVELLPRLRCLERLYALVGAFPGFPAVAPHGWAGHDAPSHPNRAAALAQALRDGPHLCCAAEGRWRRAHATLAAAKAAFCPAATSLSSLLIDRAGSPHSDGGSRCAGGRAEGGCFSTGCGPDAKLGLSEQVKARLLADGALFGSAGRASPAVPLSFRVSAKVTGKAALRAAALARELASGIEQCALAAGGGATDARSGQVGRAGDGGAGTTPMEADLTTFDVDVFAQLHAPAASGNHRRRKKKQKRATADAVINHAPAATQPPPPPPPPPPVPPPATLLLGLALTRRSTAFAELGGPPPAPASSHTGRRQLTTGGGSYYPAARSCPHPLAGPEDWWTSTTGRRMAKTTLRPTVAHCMLRAALVAHQSSSGGGGGGSSSGGCLLAPSKTLEDPRGGLFVDPMAGSGTLPELAARRFCEQQEMQRQLPTSLQMPIVGSFFVAGDSCVEAVRAAKRNADAVGGIAALMDFVVWDVSHLPLRDGVVDTMCVDMPFGKRIGSHENNTTMYGAAMQHFERACAKEARSAAVLISTEKALLEKYTRRHNKTVIVSRSSTINIGGLDATLMCLQYI